MGKTNPLISVIVPCFNQGEFLEEAVTSVLLDTYPNIEIIIVDDGSTDSFTNKLLLDYHRPKTTLYRIENSGVSHARNFGIQRSIGDYILPLDADDKIGNNYIAKAVEILEQNDRIKVVYCEAELFGNDSGIYQLEKYSFEKFLFNNSIFSSGIFRRSDFLRTNGYDEKLKVGMEDWDFWISMLKLGGEVYKLNDVCFFYRIKSHSRNTAIDEITMKQLRSHIFINHLEVYVSRYGDPISVYENYQYLLNSESYKIGKFLLSPFIYLKNILMRK